MANTSRSLFSLAQLLGRISPKVRIRRVAAPVATATPASPKAVVAATVVREDMAIFTRLLPTTFRFCCWVNMPEVRL